MKPVVPHPPRPDDDDFVLFKRIVRKAPPWFLAVLIVLGVGALLSRIVFSTYRPVAVRDAFVNLKGSFPAGDEEKGEDLDEGSAGEEEPEAEEPAAPPEPAETPKTPLEPSRWLEDVPAPAPIGPDETGPADKETDDGASLSPAVIRGGGRGERGEGPGSGSPWGSRKGTGRGDGVGRYGGNRASESAVEQGLNWLARHQADNGAWRADGFTSQCRPGAPCGGEAMKGVNYDGGVTALSLMAFLGAGYTHQKGRFRRAVKNGLDFLTAIQKAGGEFGSETTYTQALAVIVFAEAHGMTGDPDLFGPLKRGVRFLARGQQPQGGWTYDADPRKERNDTSITAFVVMALESARVAGVFVPANVFFGARRHLARATYEDGEVWYADREPGRDRRGDGMIAAGLFTSLLLGRPPDHPMVKKQLAKLHKNMPVWGDKRDLDQSYVTWYYQNLVFFALGGRDWAWWNPMFRDLLVSRQRRDGCANGSWDPEDLWGNTAGRIYATAIHVLNLEIYYKYSPLFLVPSEGEGAWVDEAGGEAPEAERGAEGGGEAESPGERLKRLEDLLERRRK